MICGNRANVTRTNPSHAHTLHELLVCLSDSGTQFIEDKPHPFAIGKLFFLPELGNHYVIGTPTAPAELIYVCFDRQHFQQYGDARLHELVQQLEHKQLYHAQNDAYASANCTLALELFSELQTGGPYTEERAHALLSLLLIRFYRMLRLGEPQARGYELRIWALCRRLQRDPLGLPGLCDAAGEVHMSRALFCREFKRTLGFTYIEFCQRVRIEQARRLLIESDRSVTQIALSSGFDHVGHFHRCFLKFTSMTPKAYRDWVRKRGAFPSCLRLENSSSENASSR